MTQDYNDLMARRFLSLSGWCIDMVLSCSSSMPYIFRAWQKSSLFDLIWILTLVQYNIPNGQGFSRYGRRIRSHIRLNISSFLLAIGCNIIIYNPYSHLRAVYFSVPFWSDLPPDIRPNPLGKGAIRHWKGVRGDRCGDRIDSFFVATVVLWCPICIFSLVV